MNKIIFSLLLLIVCVSCLNMDALASTNRHRLHKHPTHQASHHPVSPKKTSTHKKAKPQLRHHQNISPIIQNAHSSTTFDQKYLRFINHWQIPGSSVAIMQNGRFILAKGFGYANLASHEPMTPDSVFRVGSVSKAITAVTIFKLIQEGKLSLDSKVYAILNDLHPLVNARINPRIYTITIRNLLEMSSGWRTDRGVDPMMGGWSYAMTNQLRHQLPPDCKTAAQMMMTLPMQFAPGTAFSYSNINYCLLGLVINKITDTKGATGYETYVRQHILAPFGINSMQIGHTAYFRQFPNEVHYYYHDGSPNMGRIKDGLPYGYTNLLEKNYSDGGWVASAPDLVRFLHAIKQDKILNAHMINLMTSPPIFYQVNKGYFAKGWVIKQIQNHRVVLKTGSFTGTEALVMMDDTGTVYAALFNAKPSNRKIFLAQLQNKLISFAHNGGH